MRPEGIDRTASIQVIDAPVAARAWVRERNSQGRRVAFVPTMGALHEGHLALVRRAGELADDIVVSIFVNPTQFGPHEDFARYPRTWDNDLKLLSQERVGMVFAPQPAQMYGPRFGTLISPPPVATPWEGEIRPGHFQGVCTVVLKLFQIVPAQVAVFGQKDYQQARVIADMVDDLNLDITVDVYPTVRDADGLALSSRNRYLPAGDRERALALSRALDRVERRYREGVREAGELEASMVEVLRRVGVDSIDYAVVVDPLTLSPFSAPLPEARHGSEAEPVAVALITARVAGTRLLDNRLLR